MPDAAQTIEPAGLSQVIQQGLTVAGWLAMWRPMEIFRYAWWPLVADRRLYDRLRHMPVQVETAGVPEHPSAARV